MAQEILPFTFYTTTTPIEIEAHLAMHWPSWDDAAIRMTAIQDIAAYINNNFSAARDIVVCVTNDAEQDQYDVRKFLYDLSEMQIIENITTEKTAHGLVLQVSFIDAKQESEDSKSLRLTQWQKETYKAVEKIMAEDALPAKRQPDVLSVLSDLSGLHFQLKALAKQDNKPQTKPSTNLQQALAPAIGKVKHSLSVLSASKNILPINQTKIREQLNKIDSIKPVQLKETPVTSTKPALLVFAKENPRVVDIKRPVQPVYARSFTATAIRQFTQFIVKAKSLPKMLNKTQNNVPPRDNIPATNKLKLTHPDFVTEKPIATKIAYIAPLPQQVRVAAQQAKALPITTKDIDRVIKPTPSPVTIQPASYISTHTLLHPVQTTSAVAQTPPITPAIPEQPKDPLPENFNATVSYTSNNNDIFIINTASQTAAAIEPSISFNLATNNVEAHSSPDTLFQKLVLGDNTDNRVKSDTTKESVITAIEPTYTLSGRTVTTTNNSNTSITVANNSPVALPSQKQAIAQNKPKPFITDSPKVSSPNPIVESPAVTKITIAVSKTPDAAVNLQQVKTILTTPLTMPAPQKQPVVQTPVINITPPPVAAPVQNIGLNPELAKLKALKKTRMYNQFGMC